jgi:hypothetical protein
MQRWVTLRYIASKRADSPYKQIPIRVSAFLPSEGFEQLNAARTSAAGEGGAPRSELKTK